jgi:hypothetical protein
MRITIVAPDSAQGSQTPADAGAMVVHHALLCDGDYSIRCMPLAFNPPGLLYTDNPEKVTCPQCLARIAKQQPFR